MKFSFRYGLVCLFIISLVLAPNLSSFGQSPEAKGPQLAQASLKEIVGKMALIPFSSKSSLSYQQSDASLAQIERFLTISLYEALGVEVGYMPDIELMELKKSDLEFQKLNEGRPKIYYKDIAIDVGRVIGADSVMVGTISQYSERGGSEWGVESPSTVSFNVELLSTKDGSTIWQTYYTETQQPLFDNLFEIKKFVKRGAKWVTADELAKEGVREVAKRFGRFLLENR